MYIRIVVFITSTLNGEAECFSTLEEALIWFETQRYSVIVSELDFPVVMGEFSSKNSRASIRDQNKRHLGWLRIKEL
jgi:hypothetical protein